MSFEILDKDLLGRIGRLYTKSGVIETPTLFPVVNPVKQVVSLGEIKEVGFRQIITNAYLLKRHYGDLVREIGVHKFLGWDGPLMTDSGAYQLLMYGRVEITPEEILDYQVGIGTDIGVILDIPTQWGRPKEIVDVEVEETLRRARHALERLRVIDPEHKMLIVGPVQGGDRLDLLGYSASMMARLNFDIYAIGSPTTLLEEYDFLTVVRMIVTVKLRLPPGKPVHLFGAGHPLIIPIAVALGIDLFDSASYILYARDDRAMLRDRTVRITDYKGDSLPCSCPTCRKFTVKELREMGKTERERLLAIHNLHILKEELDEVKARLREGTLWEYLEEKCHFDARVKAAFLALRKGLRHFLRLMPEPSGKVRVMHVTTPESLSRPEFTRFLNRLLENYRPPNGNTLILISGRLLTRPYARDPVLRVLLQRLEERGLIDSINVVVLNPVLGPIPFEISEAYPLSQHEYPRNAPSYLSAFAKRALRLYLERLKTLGYRRLIAVLSTRDLRTFGRVIGEFGFELKILNVSSRRELPLSIDLIMSSL